MPTDTTPPVTTGELEALAGEVLANKGNVKADVPLVQKFLASNKSAAVAAVVHVAVLVVAALGLHLSGEDVAVLGSIVTVGLSYFVNLSLK